jgi:apolipoprotein N-acyltransferase
MTPQFESALKLIGRFLLVLAAAGFWWLSFPEPDRGVACWLVLTLLVLACRGLGPFAAAGFGFFFGVVGGYGIYSWLFGVAGFGFHHSLLIAAAYAPVQALFGLGLPFLRRARLPFVLTAPALWTALEFAKGHLGFLAAPWATFAQSQHENLPLLQVATLGGEAAVTFFVALGGVALAEALGRRSFRPLALPAAAIGLVHLGGLAALRFGARPAEIRVAAVQPASLYEDIVTPKGEEMVQRRLFDATREAAASRPAFVAWPETAIQDLPRRAELEKAVQALTDEIGIPIVVGTSVSQKFLVKGAELKARLRAYNSVYLYRPGKKPEGPYNKVVLLPFGEYVPLPWFPWPQWLVHMTFDVVPGLGEGSLLTLPDGLRLAPVICWENLFSTLVRHRVEAGADVVVHAANLYWFGRTEAPLQHRLPTILRAVENRVPVVVASNLGPSTVIDGWGRVVAKPPKLFAPGIVTAVVPRGSGPTFYTRFGDVFAWLTILIAAWGLASSFRPEKRMSSKSKRRKRDGHHTPRATRRNDG